MLKESLATAPSVDRSVAAAPTLDQAYRVCREIARREAKNFYYAFLALPKAKHNAICAVYAFMRHADDLSDDESLPRATRLINLRAWMRAWHAAVSQGTASDPVFVALADARLRFNIPVALLDELVQGTAMDLHGDLDRDLDMALDPARGTSALTASSPETCDTYNTFEDLYRYCYMVASVVGLVCIRIFEYGDAQAEKLAEELGIAFQLTNILRDIREDGERGRLYLPLADLAAHGVLPATLVDATQARPSTEVKRLLAFEAQRAEDFYTSGTRLLPMIAPDSRPALWVLMTIYHRLLARVRRADYDVFSERISVPAYEKFAILTRGLLRIARFRLFGRY